MAWLVALIWLCGPCTVFADPAGAFFKDGFEAIPCGDGIVQGNEACDDFNNLACGTCSADCGIVRNPAAATGLITTVSAANLADGEGFTLSDGFNLPKTFEFDLAGNGVNPGSVSIALSVIANASQVRDAIIAAINSRGDLDLTAASAGAILVALSNDRNSALGNTLPLETVNDGGFQVLGMSGGVAGDCSTSTGCTSSSDCASNECVNNVCN